MAPLQRRTYSRRWPIRKGNQLGALAKGQVGIWLSRRDKMRLAWQELPGKTERGRGSR
jgi:hypothetical protein